MVLKLLAYALLSALLTWSVRRYSLRNKIIDIPNERSSHTIPTPRGGGLGFVALFLSLIWWLPIDPRTRMALAGGILVAVVGWIDDRVSLRASVRALVHVIAAVWALFWLGGLPPIELGFARISVGILGWAIGVIGIVWLINLYNFMDGIDGLAGGQAVMAALAGGALLRAAGLTDLGELTWTLAALVFGFLVWNWAPARIFMGDVASGFLGYTFSVLAISSSHQGGPSLILWGFLLGVFILDATATLIRRVWQGEKWHEAHRTHAYQLATQMGYSHAQVTSAVLAISLALSIVAWVGWRWPIFVMPLAVFAFGGLFVIWRTVVARGLTRHEMSQTASEAAAGSLDS